MNIWCPSAESLRRSMAFHDHVTRGYSQSAGGPGDTQKYTDLYIFDDLHYARPDCAENGHEVVSVMGL